MADTRANRTGTAAAARRPRRAPRSSSDAFGPFQVLKQIGAGSLGPVYSALQHEIDCLVAVKQFNLGLSTDDTQRVQRQFDTLVCTRLDHLSIAAALGTGIRDASAYLIQEFAAGLSLAQLWDEGRTIAVPDAVRLATAIADAIDFAARAGVAHGGLKPQDIIVADAEVRVTGFGVVHALESAAVTPPARAPYAAPERLKGLPWNSRADVFSLAAIVFELVSGQALAGSDLRVLDQLEPLPDTDLAALAALFDRALSPNPARRFENASDFAQALQQACGVPVQESGAFRRRRPFALVARPPALRPQTPLPEPVPMSEVPRVAAVTVSMPPPAVPKALPAIELRTSEDLSIPPAVRPRAFETIAPAPIPVVRTTTVRTIPQIETPIAGPTFVTPAVTASEPVTRFETEKAEATPVASRRYSILWALVLGPVAGVAIGLALAMMFSGHTTRVPPRGEFIRDPEPPVVRPPVAEPPRPVDVAPEVPEEAPAGPPAVVMLMPEIVHP